MKNKTSHEISMTEIFNVVVNIFRDKGLAWVLDASKTIARKKQNE